MSILGEFRPVSEEEFLMLRRGGKLLGASQRFLASNDRFENGPPRDFIVPIAIEIAAVVIGIAVGEVAGAIANKRIHAAPAPTPPQTVQTQRKEPGQ